MIKLLKSIKKVDEAKCNNTGNVKYNFPCLEFHVQIIYIITNMSINHLLGMQE